MAHDFDFVIIGSGFGGSVSALRLAEKGYRVAVLEMGRRWRAEDFPDTNLKIHRYLWEPRALLRGFFSLVPLPHVFIARGVGVGGGSLVYANKLEGVREVHRPRAGLSPGRCGRLFWNTRQRRTRSLLWRRGAGAHGLYPVRRLHGRLSGGRQKYFR